MKAEKTAWWVPRSCVRSSVNNQHAWSHSQMELDWPLERKSLTHLCSNCAQTCGLDKMTTVRSQQNRHRTTCRPSGLSEDEISSNSVHNSQRLRWSERPQKTLSPLIPCTWPPFLFLIKAPWMTSSVQWKPIFKWLLLLLYTSIMSIRETVQGLWINQSLWN